MPITRTRRSLSLEKPAARPWLESLFRCVALVGEDQVESALRVGEYLAGLLELRFVAGAQHLGGRERDVLEQAGDRFRLVADVARERLPGGAELVAVRFDVLASGGGQLVRAPSLRFLCAHEALVLELLQRRIDRAGAGAPGAVAAVLDPLHELVAVA